MGEILAEGPEAAGRRDAAVARLRVIGDRAVRPVLAALEGSASAEVQVVLLHVLEGRQETAVAGATVRALGSLDAAVRAAAVPVARALLDDARGHELLDRLVALAVDADEATPVRLAAIGALTTLPGAVARPVLVRLAEDRDPAVRLAAAPRGDAGGGDEPGAEIEDAAGGTLPADPQRLLDALSRDAALMPLPTLHRLVTVLREREQAERRAVRMREWLTVRAAVHRALAARESRVALYDIRETLEQAEGPLPQPFLEALELAGDASCLDALAAAHARAAGDEPWRASLVAAARAIAARERLTKRSAAVKRLRTRWGEEFTRNLSTPSRTARA